MLLRPLRSILFPYTTLFRSSGLVVGNAADLHWRIVCEADDRDVPVADSCFRSDRADLAGFGTVVCATVAARVVCRARGVVDRKSTRLNSSHSQISYAVFCLK